MIKPNIFKQFSELICAFSDRGDGNMSASISNLKSQISNPLVNRENLLHKLDIKATDLILSKQTHGNQVEIVSSDHLNLADQNESPFTTADGLVSNSPGIYLAIFAADCLPIFLYEPQKQIVAAVHAGWRGLASNIIHEAIVKLQELGGRAGELRVWIGPHINVCHYDIDPDAASYSEKIDAFSNMRNIIVRRDEKLYLALTELTVRQLEEAGVVGDQVEVSPVCTAEDERFFSYHATKGVNSGIMMGVIGLGPKNQEA